MNHIAQWIEDEWFRIRTPRNSVSVFIRFGKFSKRQKSVNFNTGETERGLSVYPARLVNGEVEPDYDNITDGKICHLVSGRCAFVVTGNVVGAGSDGEPVLTGVRLLPFPIRIDSMPEFVYSQKS